LRFAVFRVSVVVGLSTSMPSSSAPLARLSLSSLLVAVASMRIPSSPVRSTQLSRTTLPCEKARRVGIECGEADTDSRDVTDVVALEQVVVAAVDEDPEAGPGLVGEAEDVLNLVAGDAVGIAGHHNGVALLDNAVAADLVPVALQDDADLRVARHRLSPDGAFSIEAHGPNLLWTAPEYSFPGVPTISYTTGHVTVPGRRLWSDHLVPA
jgi:hypothetical protein